MALLSVLTPTYNRAKCLTTLFKSLCAQTNLGFEWWIVDDGSTDGTEGVVQGFQAQTGFPIHYIYKGNSGKHTALNVAIPLIASELTIIADSDDALTSEAVEVFYTKCLREFPFPEYPGEKFLGENAVWAPMGRNYDMVRINQAIYMFEYQDGGLTKNRRWHNIASPRGCKHRAALYMERDIKMRYRIKGTMQYLIYGKFAGYSFAELWKRNHFKGLMLTSMPPAVLLYLQWKRTYNEKIYK